MNKKTFSLKGVIKKRLKRLLAPIIREVIDEWEKEVIDTIRRRHGLLRRIVP